MLAIQLTIYDELDDLEEREDTLRLLGDGPELGMALLQPLFIRGWRLHRVRSFTGSGGHLFILANGVFEAKRQGDALGDVAVELFEEAVKLSGAAA
jgi:hypothetical protein